MATLLHLHKHKDPKLMTMSEIRRYVGDKVPGSGRHRLVKEADRRINRLTNGHMQLHSKVYRGDSFEHWVIDRDGHMTWISLDRLIAENDPYESCPRCANTPLDLRRFGIIEQVIEFTLSASHGSAVFAPDQELGSIDDRYLFLCQRHRCTYITTFRYFLLDALFSADCPLCAANSPPHPR